MGFNAKISSLALGDTTLAGTTGSNKLGTYTGFGNSATLQTSFSETRSTVTAGAVSEDFAMAVTLTTAQRPAPQGINTILNTLLLAISRSP